MLSNHVLQAHVEARPLLRANYSIEILGNGYVRVYDRRSGLQGLYDPNTCARYAGDLRGCEQMVRAHLSDRACPCSTRASVRVILKAGAL